MTELAISSVTRSAEFEKRIRRRYAAERRFRIYGLTAVVTAFAILPSPSLARPRSPESPLYGSREDGFASTRDSVAAPSW